MTNQLQAITVALVTTLATNWTSFYHQNREAGIIGTNYFAQIVFEGKTNTLLLKSDYSSMVVWGEPTVEFIRVPNITNFVIPPGHGGVWITNLNNP